MNTDGTQEFLDRQGAIDAADFEAWNGSFTPAEVLDAGDAAVAEVNVRRGRM